MLGRVELNPQIGPSLPSYSSERPKNHNAEIAGFVPDLDISITDTRNSPKKALTACKRILTYPRVLMGEWEGRV